MDDQSDALRLDENNMAALNNERVVQIDFIFLSAVLTKESILFQRRVKFFFFYLVTEFITYSETGCSFARHFAILARNVGILIGSLLRASCDSNFDLLPEQTVSHIGIL